MATAEEAINTLLGRIQELERRIAEKETESYRDLEVGHMTIGDLDRFVIEPLKGKPAEQPDMVGDEAVGIYHDPIVARYHMFVDNEWGPPDRYEWIRGGYLFAILFEAAEDFFDYARREGKDSVKGIKKDLADINKISVERAEIIAKYNKEAKETGTPGNSSEEAQHYENSRIRPILEDLYERTEENKKSAYNSKALGIVNLINNSYFEGKLAKTEG